MSLVSDVVLKRFTVLYGEPKTSDFEAFIAEYETALKGYHEPILRQAVDRVVQANEYRSWPMPGEICKACHDIGLGRLKAERRTVRAPEPDYPAPSPDSAARVRALAQKFAAEHSLAEASQIKRWRPDVSRDAMEDLQRNSKNAVHRKGVSS